MNATGHRGILYSVRFASFVGLAAALAACTARLPVPTLLPTRTPPATSPASIAVPPATATTAATSITLGTHDGALAPGPAASGQNFPLFSGEQYQLLDWSPDGRHLAFLSLSGQDLQSTPFPGQGAPPPGTFQILDTQTGKGCSYRQFNDLGLNFTTWHTWLPGSRLVVTTLKGKLVALSQPCGGSLQIPTASETAMISPDLPPGTTFSPGGSYRAYSLEKDGSYTLVVVRSHSGNSVASIPWKPVTPPASTPPGPEWINDSQLLLPQTASGPMLVTLGEAARVQSVGPVFFQIPANRRQVAAGAGLIDPANQGASDFHLALSDLDPLDNLRRIWLYRSQDQAVEKLPFAGASFSKDGQLLFLTDDMGYLWVRPVDPAGSSPIRLASEQDQPGVALHPIRQLAAIASLPSRDAPATIRLISLPDGAVQHVWQLGEQYGVYHYNALSWSPDGRYLAAVGFDPTDHEQQALFILPFEAP